MSIELSLCCCVTELQNKGLSWGRRVGGRVQVGKAQVTHLFISWSDTILREISTFSSAFPKGDPAKQPDRHQPVRCKLGHPGVSLSSTYK